MPNRTPQDNSVLSHRIHADPKLIKKAAEDVLATGKRNSEGTIRQKLLHLLTLMGVEDLETEISADSKRIDAFSDRYRLVIETKALGKAKADVQNQIEPYVHSKIALEYEYQQSLFGSDSDRHWTALITDGNVFRVSRYPNVVNCSMISQPIISRPKTSEDLINTLEEILAGDPVGKPKIPQNPYSVLENDLDRLHEIYDGLADKQKSDTETKFELWKIILRSTGMEPESETERKLFVRQSFLIATARNVSRIMVCKNPEEDPLSIIGDGFASWIVQDPEGATWQKNYVRKLNQYDWRRQKGDVLRNLYHNIVDVKDRKTFGEHYTPDWLAEMVATATLDDEWLRDSVRKALSGESLEGIGALEPTSGSGTIAYHMARRIAGYAKTLHLSPIEIADVVTKLIFCLEIHPVGTEITKATVLRALPASPTRGEKALNIWQGDSLMLHGNPKPRREKRKSDSAREISLTDMVYYKIAAENLVFTIPKSGAYPAENITLPLKFCESHNFNHQMHRLIAFAKRGELATDILDSMKDPNDRRNLERANKAFIQVIRDRGNSVWAWYIINITAPAFLKRRKINRIAANPPWVRMSNIQVETRKRILEDAFVEYNLWSGGSRAGTNDIAKLFVKMCRNIYMNDIKGDAASWIVKCTAIRSGQWEKLRKSQKGMNAKIINMAAMNVFGPGDAKKSCVMLENQDLSVSAITELQSHNSAEIILLRPEGKSKKPDPNSNAKMETVLKKALFQKAPPRIPQEISGYPEGDWRAGNRIDPHVLVIIEKSIPAKQSKDRMDITTIRSQNDPWNKVEPMVGEIPNSWVKRVCSPDNLYPFAISSEPRNMIVPVDQNDKLLVDPGKTDLYWKDAETIYQRNRGKGASTPKTLLGKINQWKNLSMQLDIAKESKKTTLLYPLSGDIMRSSRLAPGQILVDYCIFRQNFQTEEEPAYLCSVLNAPCMKRAFAECRDTCRHFDKNPWIRVPIPKYDPENPDHTRLAQFCVDAEDSVARWFAKNSEQIGKKQIETSKRIRVMLTDEGIFSSIDDLVRKILPNQAR